MAKQILDPEYNYYSVITERDKVEKNDIPFAQLDYLDRKIVYNRGAKGRANVNLCTALTLDGNLSYDTFAFPQDILEDDILNETKTRRGSGLQVTLTLEENKNASIFREKIHKHNYKLSELPERCILGKGTFGVVIKTKSESLKGEHIIGDECRHIYIAEKRLKEFDKKAVVMETTIYNRIKTSNLALECTIELFATYTSSLYTFQYFELITGPPFYKYRSVFGDEYRPHIIKELIKGLHAIIKLGIIHCDIKGDNILIDIKSRPFTPKYIDFGLAVITPQRDSNSNDAPYIYRDELEHSDTPRDDFSPGNKYYAYAYEVENHYRTPRTDIYALFVTLNEIYGDNIGDIIDVNQILIDQILQQTSLWTSFIAIHKIITHGLRGGRFPGARTNAIEVEVVPPGESGNVMKPHAHEKGNNVVIDQKVNKYNNEKTIDDDISSFYKQGMIDMYIRTRIRNGVTENETVSELPTSLNKPLSVIGGKGKSIKYKKYRKLKTKRISKKDQHLKNNNIKKKNTKKRRRSIKREDK